MNILIDIKFLYEKDCGIKTFLYNTLEELFEISEENNNNSNIDHINIDVIGLSGKITKLTREHLNLENIAKKQKFFNSVKNIIAGNSFLYPSIKKIYRFGKKQINKINNSINNNTDSAHYDIFWTPYQTEIDLNIAKKKFITIYDLYLLTNAETSIKEHSAAFKNYIDKYLAFFDGVTTCSEFVKKDVINFYNYPENKIYIVKSAYDKNIFKKISDKNILQSFKDKYHLNNPFILYIGALHPRKNILNLLKAFKSLKKLTSGETEKNISAIKNLELVLVSNTSFLDKETLILLDELKDYVKIFKHIGNEELALFYNAAEVFAFPSLYEGFGIPPLEAFACGTPVITSNITAIPEVCGDAAYYVDPNSINDIENAIFNIITSEKLKKDLITKGFKRAESFSWRQSAINLLSAFTNELKN
ncbi:MAG: glycosyltransferase family 4 protein [bacterium]